MRAGPQKRKPLAKRAQKQLRHASGLVGGYVERPRKPARQQLAEMRELARRYRYPPYHYVTYDLYLQERADDDPNEYVPTVFLNRFRRGLNPVSARDVVDDKDAFARVLGRAGMPVVPTLFTITAAGIADATGRVVDPAAMVAALHDQGHDRVFVKPAAAFGGFGNMLLEVGPEGFVDEDGRVGPDALFGRLAFRASRTVYLVQPVIRQHPALAAINDASVNTMRMDTLVTDGSIGINGAFLRTSDGTNHTDNISSGGWGIRVDLDRGALGGLAWANRPSKAGRRYTRVHPRTGYRFAGTPLPYWQAIVDLVTRAAQVVLPLRHVGWDIAFGETGPILVEGNAQIELEDTQVGAAGLRHRPIGLLLAAEHGWR